MALEIRLSEDGKTVKEWKFASAREAIEAAWNELRSGLQEREAKKKLEDSPKT